MVIEDAAEKCCGEVLRRSAEMDMLGEALPVVMDSLAAYLACRERFSGRSFCQGVLGIELIRFGCDKWLFPGSSFSRNSFLPRCFHITCCLVGKCLGSWLETSLEPDVILDVFVLTESSDLITDEIEV